MQLTLVYVPSACFPKIRGIEFCKRTCVEVGLAGLEDGSGRCQRTARHILVCYNWNS